MYNRSAQGPRSGTATALWNSQSALEQPECSGTARVPSDNDRILRGMDAASSDVRVEDREEPSRLRRTLTWGCEHGNRGPPMGCLLLPDQHRRLGRQRSRLNRQVSGTSSCLRWPISTFHLGRAFGCDIRVESPSLRADGCWVLRLPTPQRSPRTPERGTRQELVRRRLD